MDIFLRPKKITWILSLAVVFLSLANIPAQYIKLNYARGTVIRRVVNFFDVNIESSLPTLFSTLILLFSAALLWMIAASKRKGGDPYARHWFYLAVIFLYLTVDEAAGIHEISTYLVRLVLGGSGPIKHFHWLIPYGILMCVFLLAYLKFLAALPRRTRLLFVVSGGVFVAGAWGTEIVVDQFIVSGDLRLWLSSYHLALNSVEELMEMTGIVVFIYALASYMASEVRGSVIRIIPGPAP